MKPSTQVHNAHADVHIDEIEQFLKYSTSHLNNAQDIVDWIKEKASKYMDEESLEKIQHAYEYAASAHEWQIRLSWEPYIIHPLRATEILMSMKPDVDTIQTCILHDVLEDTPITYDDIKGAFGATIAELCEGLVKVSKVRYKGEDRQIETLKKTFLAMARDLRVIFVKIADRVHNIQTLHFHPKPEKRRRIAMETLKIYVPICKKLGLYNYQVFLENWVFKILYPEGYRRVLDYLKKKYGKSEQYIAQGKKKIEKIMKKAGIKDFMIKARVKSPYRIYEKLTKKYQTTDFSKVLDVLAFRVVVSSVSDCYYTLWVIHKYYSPLINKIKDYIAVPKFNNYQSLHTTVLGMFSFPIEIQIRTAEMEQIAEYWVAAHLAYSDSVLPSILTDKQSKWISELKELVHSYKDKEKQEEFKTELDIEVLNKNIFVYTPKGDVIEFPVGSTLLDFAFRVHTDLWLKFKHGLVNWVIKPINHILQTWDVVSVTTFKNKYTANKHWSDFLHTPTAKTKLARFIRAQERDYYIQRGIEIFNKSLEKYDLPALGSEWDLIESGLSEEELHTYMLSLVDKQRTSTSLIRRFYPKELSSYLKMMEEQKKAKKEQDVKSNTKSNIPDEVVVDGLKRLPLELCKLCHPQPKQKILAKVDKSWIKIHRVCCKALKSISFNKLMEAHWLWQEVNNYSVKLVITMPSKPEFLVSLMSLFKELDIAIEHMNVDHLKDDMFSVTVESVHQNPTKIAFLLKDLKEQNRFIEKISTEIL